MGKTRPFSLPPFLSAKPLAFETPEEYEDTCNIQSRMPSCLEEVINSTELALVITEITAPFRITHVNQTWCEVCGFSMEEAIGRTCRILQGPNSCRLTIKALEDAAHNLQPITVKLINYTKVCPVLCTTAPRFFAELDHRAHPHSTIRLTRDGVRLPPRTADRSEIRCS